MAAAFPMFHVSPNGYTFKLSGQPVTNLSYPALSFEAYLPLLAALVVLLRQPAATSGSTAVEHDH